MFPGFIGLCIPKAEEVGQQFAKDHGAKIDQSKLLNDVFTSA